MLLYSNRYNVQVAVPVLAPVVDCAAVLLPVIVPVAVPVLAPVVDCAAVLLPVIVPVAVPSISTRCRLSRCTATGHCSGCCTRISTRCN